ncbi:MAG: L-rhamnonate dehydratase [Bryobacterales bacterium]|nr:L-rhamnonate dehydratase [Bryobacterales bacterium]
MNRRTFFSTGLAASAAGTAGAAAQTPDLGKSKMKITSVRLVNTKPKRPAPRYAPSPGSWGTQSVEVANPMSIYEKYKATRSLFFPDAGKVPGFTVEIATDKGVKGYGSGGAAGGVVVEGHLTKLLLGEDPFDIEKLWDILWRSTMHYGRMGVTMNAISGVDLALWDLIGNAVGMPVYKLLGGRTKDRIPAYCTGNDIEQHVEFGFKRLKLAMPHGPADGREGMRKNVEVVQRARAALGRDGDIMLDCWMAWTERYTMEMAEMLEPLRVYWMEEVLQPHDYAGFGRLRKAVRSTRIVTGEHEYGRYGFRSLLEHESAEIWQPDLHWCGGLTEMRKIAAMAAAYDIPVIPHGGGTAQDGLHFIMATTNSPWAEMFLPPPGGPPEVYRRFEEEYGVTRGAEGIYAAPAERPGFGWEFEAA